MTDSVPKWILDNWEGVMIKTEDFFGSHWVPGWKYKAKNTGDTPVMFLFGLTNTPPGYTRRRTEGLP